MHENQLEVTAEDVRALVAAQFPNWSHLAVTPVASHGTVHLLFRIGPELVARLPMQAADPDVVYAALAAERDAAQTVRGQVPVATPEPVALGAPGDRYPLPWAVYRWIPGSVAHSAHEASSPELGQDVGVLVRALREIPTDGRSFDRPGRGGQLADLDDDVRACLSRDTTPFRVGELADLWSRLRRTPRHEPDVTTHGDLMPGNLLLTDGRLSAVLDVGMLGPADPALDLMPAWNLLQGAGRDAFRSTVDVDGDQWERGKAWAFGQAIGCLDYYRETNPVMSATAVSTLAALLADEERVLPRPPHG
jgi:aminoglycoside phosphotransferase (APT) family kinase protein